MMSESADSAKKLEPLGVDEALRARFEEVALPHLDAVYRTARVLGSDEAEADDLVQETFTRALRAFGGFELREYGARPWLLRILRNVFYTRKGRERREPTLLDDVDFDHFADELLDPDVDPAAADSINWDHFDEELKAAVAQLQPEYRAVLLLWSIEGLSYKEIAAVCDCALGTVMSRLYRARQLLGRKLRDYARERKIDTQRFS
ncbi:MAG: sigma-70 family RNA polymerase sigma factor [Phycisphaerae bacterium]|jgi:RNA polymerase sigma-70 factor (ECF subfamily)